MFCANEVEIWYHSLIHITVLKYDSLCAFPFLKYILRIQCYWNQDASLFNILMDFTDQNLLFKKGFNKVNHGIIWEWVQFILFFIPCQVNSNLYYLQISSICADIPVKGFNFICAEIFALKFWSNMLSFLRKLYISKSYYWTSHRS